MENVETKFDPYEILGLPHGTSMKLVRAAYKTLIRAYHPDVYRGDKELGELRLKEFNEAYEFLKDFKRKFNNRFCIIINRAGKKFREGN